MTSEPIFSFVATSRNDDHGGDVLRRTQSFINQLAAQCERHQVASELVLVEWNPPPQRAPLEEVLAWPAGSHWFSARIISVPRELHQRLKYSRRLPLFQMIGKNVGIRRALGKFIVATNIDIIFSDELFQWLKREEISSGVLYRSDRWDIPNEVQLEPILDALLMRARQEAIRHNKRDGTYVKRDGAFRNGTPNRFDDVFYNPLRSHLDDFRDMLARHDSYTYEALLSKLDEICRPHLSRLRRNLLIPVLHTNGCGDFTLLSRQDWFALRGYPEWHIFSWTIDSILLFQAYYNGLKIEELDPTCVHYHIEHDYGSGWTPEGAGSLWKRLEERGIPYMSYDQFTRLVYELQDNAAQHRFTVYNGLDWGFPHWDVKTRLIVAEGTAARRRSKINLSPLNEDFFAECDRSVLWSPNQPLASLCGSRVERLVAENDQRELLVETPAPQWSYALAFDLPRIPERPTDYWLTIAITIDEGSVGIGILDAERSDFVIEEQYTASSAPPARIAYYIKNGMRASSLIFRNSTPGGKPARFRLRQIQILTDSAARGAVGLSPNNGRRTDPTDAMFGRSTVSAGGASERAQAVTQITASVPDGSADGGRIASS